MSSKGSPDTDASAESPPLRGRSRFFGSRTAFKSPAEALQPVSAPPPPALPPKRKRPRSGLSTLSGILTFLLIGSIAGVFGVVAGAQKLRQPGPLAADRIVAIAPRTDVPDIIARLESEGVIDSPLLMNMALVAEGSRSKLKAGEYQFKQNASLQDVIDMLTAGRIVTHSFTIPEGLTSEQIVARLRDQELLDSDIKDVPKEGALLPATYKFARGDLREKQLQRMADEQKKVLAEIWARRAADLPLKSPFELVTLASIVEKETGKADERPRVAGVFINRLAKRMRLQSDPTIVYGLVGGKGTLGRPITRADLDKVTPYNTYHIDGLPPGPIGNPGRAAMEAVANPSRTQELFFVADGTGGHVFAETLDQHNRNVQRWRQIEKDAKDKLAPDAEKSVVPGKPGEQRGDASDALPVDPHVFGALPTAFAPNSTSPDGAAIAKLANALTRQKTVLAGKAAIAASALAQTARPALLPPASGDAGQDLPASAFALGPGLDELGIKVRGVNDSPLDGTSADLGDDTAAGDPNSYPVPAVRRSEQKARAAKFGLATGDDRPPPQMFDAVPAPPLPVNPQAQARSRAFDASEGTRIDPLRNKTFDLNSAKTVPSFR